MPAGHRTLGAQVRARASSAGELALDENEVLEAFAAHHRARNLSRETTKRVLVILHAVSRDTGTPLLELKRHAIEEWLGRRPRSARTRNCYLSYLASFYKWAIGEELTALDPTRAIPRPKLPRTLPRPIADSDLELAIQTADDRIRTWLCLGAYEGMRAKEIAGLLGEDVLLEREPPLIRVTASKGDRERFVPINPITAVALLTHGIPRRGPVFPGACAHESLRPGTVTKYLSRHLAGLGIRSTGHSLRHWFGTTVYKASTDLRMVQELLGHSSPTTTAGYAAFDPGAAVKIVQALGQRARDTATHLPALGLSTPLVLKAIAAKHTVAKFLILSHPLPHTPW